MIEPQTKSDLDVLLQHESIEIVELVKDIISEGMSLDQIKRFVAMNNIESYQKLEQALVPHIDLTADGLVVGAKHLREEITEQSHPGLSQLSPIQEDPEKYMGMYKLGKEFIPATTYISTDNEGFVTSITKVPDDQQRVQAMGAKFLRETVKMGVANSDNIAPLWIDAYGDKNGTKFINGELVQVDAAVNRAKKEAEERAEILTLLRQQANR